MCRAMFCRGTRRKRIEMRIPLSATKIELDPILGRAKNEFGTDPSLV